MGARKIDSRTPEPFGERSQADAAGLAGLASAVLTVAETESRRRDAIDRRDLIARAQGVVMAWQRCTAEEAAAILRRTSVRHHRAMADVAAVVLAACTEPED